MLLCILAPILLVSGEKEPQNQVQIPQSTTVLLLGKDDASGLADFVALFNLDAEQNSVMLVQIPRDTYCSYESENSKINHLYSHFRLLGLSDKEALARVTEFIGNQLGVSFDGYLGITTEGFRNSVDAIGGVRVLLNERFVYESRDPSRSFVLEPGENTLNGEQAEVFVRYRSGYLTGDLGRLDTQKIFLKGLFETLSSVNGYDEAFSILRKIQKNVITDFSAVAMGILSGLKDLHRNGKVHRDLKPENVLLRSDGTAVLTDFGISGDRNKRMTERNIVGTPKEIFGTYAYMPPEQVNPKRGDATVLPTTDIYSFGVMMYQILTFEMPFGNLSNHADLVPYLDKSKKGQWDKRCLAQARNGYGSRWLNVIDGCLNPDYTKRLSSVDEVMALIPHSAGLRRPVPVKPDSGETGKVTGKILLRMMHGEEYGQTYPLAELLAGRKNILTVGRKDPYIKNDIEITENHSTYISRKHCTIEYDRSRSRWIVRDGQWVTSPVAQWKDSLNGTYVNSFKVSQSGLLIKTGDIISIGDVKLRVEEY